MRGRDSRRRHDGSRSSVGTSGRQRRTVARLAAAAALATAGIGTVLPAIVSSPAGAITPPSPPFTECPAIGADTSCAVLIVLNADGTTSVLQDSTQGPYDGTEDTLVGVLNDSSGYLPSLQLSASGIFGFDGDGICTYSAAAGGTGFTGDGYCDTSQAAGTDPQDYQGPDNVLTIGSTTDSGTVAFTDSPAGLPPGKSSYFSLEEVPGTEITIPPASTISFTSTSATTGDYNDPVTVAATVLGVEGAPVSGATVTFTLGSAASAPTCTGTTDGTGTASCTLTPNMKAGPQTLFAAFNGNSELLGSSANATFTVTLEQDAIAYTGGTSATNGSPLTLSGALTTDDPSAGTVVADRTVTLSLGSGSSAQSCTGITNAAGTASCTIASVAQTVGSVPAMASFASDGFYEDASASAAVTVAGAATAPASSPAASSPAGVAGATTVHTGEPFGGSRPVELAVAGAGLALFGAGMARRRRAMASASRS